MGKKPSLFHQLLSALREQQRFGESKHQAKKIAIAQAHSKGQSGFGATPEGIYAIGTFASYRQVAREYADWCRRNTHARTIEEAKFYAGFYIQERIEFGLSAWTIQRDRSALRKIFRDSDLAWEIEVPIRHLSDIKRSRLTVAMDKHFDVEEHRDIIDFCLATGLRRHELVAICPRDIWRKDGKLVALVKQGKGGKRREVTVLEDMEFRVIQIIAGRSPDEPIFRKVPQNMDVHNYRSKYAQSRLEYAPEEVVTRDMGHNRTDVMRYHYARKN
jgi:integrase